MLRKPTQRRQRHGSASRVRKHFRRGQCLLFLKSLSIDKTRCSKACAIYNAFASLDMLADLTVEEAYAARPRKKAAQQRQTQSPATTPTVALTDALVGLEERSVQFQCETSRVTHGELTTMLGAVRRAMDGLEELEREIQRRLEEMES